MRQNLREQLFAKETEIENLMADNAKLSQELVKRTCENEGLKRTVQHLTKQMEELKLEANHYRRNRAIAEARMSGFVQATTLFIKGGKVGPDGQN